MFEQTMEQAPRPAPVRDPDKSPAHPDRAESTLCSTQFSSAKDNNIILFEEAAMINGNVNFSPPLSQLANWKSNVLCEDMCCSLRWENSCRLPELFLCFEHRDIIVTSLIILDMRRIFGALDIGLDTPSQLLGPNWVHGLSEMCAPCEWGSMPEQHLLRHALLRELRGLRYHIQLRLRRPITYLGLYAHSADPPLSNPPEYNVERKLLSVDPATGNHAYHTQALFELHTPTALSRVESQLVLLHPTTSLARSIHHRCSSTLSQEHISYVSCCIQRAADMENLEELLSQTLRDSYGVPRQVTTMGSPDTDAQEESAVQPVDDPMAAETYDKDWDLEFWSSLNVDGMDIDGPFVSPELQPCPINDSFLMYDSQLQENDGLFASPGSQPCPSDDSFPMNGSQLQENDGFFTSAEFQPCPNNDNFPTYGSHLQEEKLESPPEMEFDSSSSTMSPPSTVSVPPTPSETNLLPCTSVGCSPTQPQFPCMEEFCKRSFDRRYKLYKHFKTSHQKNIPCPYAPQGCPRKFSTPKDRKRHVETVHDKLRPFACSVCGKRYGRKDNLRVHMKKVHKPE